jgi:hypothetical protein
MIMSRPIHYTVVYKDGSGFLVDGSLGGLAQGDNQSITSTQNLTTLLILHSFVSENTYHNVLPARDHEDVLGGT